MAKSDSSVAKKPKKKGEAAPSKVGRFFREYKSEFKKIVWPTPRNVFKNMGITMGAIAVIGAFVVALDYGLLELLGLIMSVAK